jgi:hypothetical protein
MNFNIDVNKWVNNMLPTAMRKPVVKAFLKVLVTPVLAYYSIAGAHYQAKLNEIAPNLLTDILQAYLRTLYPNTVSGNYKCWVYNQHELTPQIYLQFIGGHMLQEFDYSIGETFTQEYDYTILEHRPAAEYVVVIPTIYNVSSNSVAIMAILSKYKPAGKSFAITFQNIV